MEKIKMTKAFVKNISEEFITGIGQDTHSFDNIEELLNDKKELIKYAEHCLGLYEVISCDSEDALGNYAIVKCYRSFLSKVKGGK